MINKKYEELTFADDFMFGKITEDKELSRKLLSVLLQKEVGELNDVLNEKEYKYIYNGKKIRLDLYSRDKDNIYDTEMQNRNDRKIEELELPKRSHYYHSMIAVDQLDKGDDYGFLDNSNVLFICTFDPFGMDSPYYHFSMRDEKYNTLELNDGVHSYFFNSTYTGDGVSEGICNLYRYIQKEEVSDELTSMIHEAVEKARMNSKWRSIYMKERIILMEERKAGREEGREEGIYDTLLELVKDGLLSISDAAKRVDKTVDEFESMMKNHV